MAKNAKLTDLKGQDSSEELQGLHNLSEPEQLGVQAINMPEIKGLSEEFRDSLNNVIIDGDPECSEKSKVLTIDSPQIKSFKLSVISKPNEIRAFIPDFSLSDKDLKAMGLEKEADGWHVSNREWFPNAISERDIVIMYGPNDLGFCSQEEFGMIYTNSNDYKRGQIKYIDPKNLKPGEMIEATKCASGEFVIVP